MLPKVCSPIYQQLGISKIWMQTNYKSCVSLRADLWLLCHRLLLLHQGCDYAPEFYIASNFPDGANFVVNLKGKAGTLLNAIGYNKSVFVEIQKKMAKTMKFTFEGAKSLPRGEYSLTIYDAEQQSEDVAKALQILPNVKGLPPGITGNHKFFSVDTLFLGGKNDDTYKNSIGRV